VVPFLVISFSILSSFRENYDVVDPSSSVTIDPKYILSHSGKKYVSAVSSGNRQLTIKICNSNDTVIYLRKDSKTSESGRKLKYEEEEVFIMQQVIERWETGNPLSKSAYDILIVKFGHETEADRIEWELKMGIHSGSITPGFSQWLSRVLTRHRFSIRKKSTSQSVPVNWLQICVEATALIRQNMASIGVTRSDEMFLQFYPKESHLIAPTNVNRVGSNRGEDDKKGCTVMVACEMFESRMMAPYIIMTRVRDNTGRLLPLSGMVTLLLSRGEAGLDLGCSHQSFL
jgi:hypothetical protein